MTTWKIMRHRHGLRSPLSFRSVLSRRKRLADNYWRHLMCFRQKCRGERRHRNDVITPLKRASEKMSTELSLKGESLLIWSWKRALRAGGPVGHAARIGQEPQRGWPEGGAWIGSQGRMWKSLYVILRVHKICSWQGTSKGFEVG